MIREVFAAIGILRAPPGDIDESYCVTDGYSEQVALTKAARLSLTILMAFSLLIGALSAAIAYTTLNYQPILAVGETERHSALRLTPDVNPKVMDRHALKAAKERGIALTSINFSDYKQQLLEGRNWFSGDGWKIYMDSLTANKVVETVVKDGLVITSISSSDPVLVRKYVLNGKLNWLIKVPIYQTVQGAAKVPSISKRVLILTMEEARRDQSPDGLLIREFSVGDR